MLNKRRINGGFTLVELVVTIAVVGVLALMVTSILVFAANASNKQSLKVAAADQLIDFKNEFFAFCGRYDDETYKLTVNNDRIVFNNGGDVNGLAFDSATKKLTLTQNSATLKDTVYDKIENVAFIAVLSNEKVLITLEVRYRGGSEKIAAFIKAAGFANPVSP